MPNIQPSISDFESFGIRFDRSLSNSLSRIIYTLGMAISELKVIRYPEKKVKAVNSETSFRTLNENKSPADHPLVQQTPQGMLAMMSHEIRTPLGVMNGYAEILANELKEYEESTGNPLPYQIKEFVGAIHENAQRLLTLVNEMFDLSNMSQLKLTPIGLHDVLEPIAEKTRRSLADKGVAFQLNLSPENPVVRGNAARLSQVFTNLLSNAVKFTHSGSVTVSTRSEGQEVVIEVADTGIGISQAYLDQLFTPFLQEDTRLNRNFTGAGLGLAVVKLLVDLMKGRIEVESEKGAGSTFRIYLPRIE